MNAPSHHVALVAQGRIDTPLGPLTLAATTQGLAGAWFDGQAHHPGPLDAPIDPSQAWLREATAQLSAYFAGQRRSFTVPLDPAGTEWQQAVWRQLLAIPMGATIDYGTIAGRLGRPQAARAVGAAVGRNPVSVIVPCHRVLGRGGALTGYAGGLDRKRKLLALEQAEAPPRALAQAETPKRVLVRGAA